MRDYFGVHGLPPIYDDADSERRFRMPRVLFQKIYDDAKDEPFFQQRINATGQLQAHPLQKIVGALRVLAYGEAADRAEEYVRISGSTIQQAVGHFTRFIVQRYQSIYLHKPAIDELGVILARNEERGLPGCIGSLDCSHLQWAACPKGHAGAYQDRRGTRRIAMETICDMIFTFITSFSVLPVP